MEEKPELVLQAHIELAGIWGRVARELELAHYMVAVGLHSSTRMDGSWLDEPGQLFRMQYNREHRVPLEDVRTYWKTWVLRGGFRDVAETLATTLEEVHRILALWSLIPKGSQSGAKVALTAVHQMEKDIEAFHAKNLPDKLGVLAKRHAFSFPPDIEAELFSINAARNCLVHRGGIVGGRDLDEGVQTFTLKWRALCPYVRDNAGERPMVLPFQTSQTDETFMILKSEAKTRVFNLGDVLTVTSEEFTWIAWTQLNASQWAAGRLEEIGSAMGFEIQGQSGSAAKNI